MAQREDETHVQHPLDVQLVASSRGDDQAFALLYEALAPAAYGIAPRILRDPHHAEEVTQEAFLEAWQRSFSFDPTRGSARSWVMTRVHSRAVDRVRSTEAWRRRDTPDVARHCPATADPTAREAHASLDAQVIRSALHGLTQPQRQALELAYFYGNTYRDVARILQIPLGAVKTRIRQGLLTLRKRLKTDIGAAAP